MKNVKWLCIFILLSLSFNNIVVIAESAKYPDYAYEFLGEDKYENMNRKVFGFNQGLNKYFIRPLHILWASIMPQFCMDRFYGISDNIEYPIRLVSSLVQKDFSTSKNESIRFFTNTVLGLGGMFDPAKHIFRIEQSKENMEQALEKCNIKSGKYFVAPIISFTNVRDLIGRLLDMALNPGSYIGTPVMAAVKVGLTINRTSYIQTLLKMVESNYADPYEITKKAYGIDCYIKHANLDRVDVLSGLKVQQDVKRTPEYRIINQPQQKDLIVMDVASEIVPNKFFVETDAMEKLDTNSSESSNELNVDIELFNYCPQCPVVDAMRTALFSLAGQKKSFWNELSLWNREFSNRIRSASVSIDKDRDEYKYRYILQKDKTNSPLVIVYPSIGEGIMAEHSVTIGKMFYDLGYSVIILGSHFQWEFVRSMPKDYCPGIPAKDAKCMRELTAKIIAQLQDKYDCEFNRKVIIGTSFGAYLSLFVASQESKENTLGNVEYISICPPINLFYAMKQVDKYSEEWNKTSEDFKLRAASTAAKIVKLYQSKKDIDSEVNNLPFNEDEGKLITGFLMHQKLSDIIYTIENCSPRKKSDIYYSINNMGYEDYAKKYLFQGLENITDEILDSVSLSSITDYLMTKDNYRIYHSLNDYLTNTDQLRKLKKITGKNLVLLDNGSHLGFLYRKEFLEDLKNLVAVN